MNLSNDETTRRSFLAKAGAALGIVATSSSVAAAASAPPSTKAGVAAPRSAELPQLNARLGVGLIQTGWNIYATRFVFAPTWTWEPIAGAAAYVVQFAHESDT